jgi:hypothetical protein
VYPVFPKDNGVKIQPEKMVREKLYYCIFKNKVLLFYKDMQDVLNCYEIEEEDLVKKIKTVSDDDIEKILEDYIEQKDLNIK